MTQEVKEMMVYIIKYSVGNIYGWDKEDELAEELEEIFGAMIDEDLSYIMEDGIMNVNKLMVKREDGAYFFNCYHQSDEDDEELLYYSALHNIGDMVKRFSSGNKKCWNTIARGATDGDHKEMLDWAINNGAEV